MGGLAPPIAKAAPRTVRRRGTRRAAAAGGLTAIGLLSCGRLAAILRRREPSLQRYGRVVPPDRRTAPAREEELGRVLEVLRRVLPLAGAVSRVVRTLAVVGLAAGAAIVLAVLAVVGVPHSLGDVVLIVVIAALLAAPGVVLLVFFFAVNELLELPTRLRELPRTGREHLDAIVRLQREARTGARPRWRAPLTLWRLLDFLRSSSWILRPYAPIVAVFSPPLLLAVALAVLATLLLVPAALIALIVAAVA